MTWLRPIRTIAPPGVATLLVALALLGAPARARAADPGWPRQFDSASGSFVIYEPQPESLSGDRLTGRAAFSLQKGGDPYPTFGVLWFAARIEIDRDSSTVTLRGLDVTKVRMPQITAEEEDRYGTLVENEAARWDLSGSLDELRAGLAAAEKERASVDSLDNAPPRILFTTRPSILVAYDGKPVLEPIEGTKLGRVANTPYAVVFDPASHAYYLNGANLWYTAASPLGPWSTIARPPAAVRASLPPDTSSADQVVGAAPAVVTATEPTELIWTDGEPRYAPLVDGELLYVTNTESDVLRVVNTQAVYVLLAGRWYSATTLDGPWTYVRPDELPAVFRRIPSDGPRGNVLASVAGTDQADDAVADAEIPQTSAIDRSTSDLEIEYDGAPEFEPIPGTELEYAVNTDAEVIYADGRYYACDQGVWYVADDPNGPWQVSETRPIGVDDIPPSCPVYNVRYVYVYDVTPEVVYVGYLPGYVGSYPCRGTVVYGTGHHYRPWWSRHHYYPHPVTWGFDARYNPWLSRWSFGFSFSSGFLRVGSRWHPEHPAGAHVRPAMWFGPSGYHRPLLTPDRAMVRTRAALRVRPAPADRLPANLYNRTQNVGRVNREAARLPLRPIAHPAPRSAPLPNNVFAGRDGRVYQRDDKGNWTVNDGREWKPTVEPIRPVGGRTTQGDAGQAAGTSPSWLTPRVLPRPGTTPSPAQRSGGRVEAPQRPQPQPAPVRPAPAQPSGGMVQPQQQARPAPANPGNLERAFRARERASQGESPQVSAPAPRPEPPRPAPARREPAQPEREKKGGRGHAR